MRCFHVLGGFVATGARRAAPIRSPWDRLQRRIAERGGVSCHLADLPARSRRNREPGGAAVRHGQSADGAAGGRNVLRIHGPQHFDPVRSGPRPVCSGLPERELLAATAGSNASTGAGAARFQESRRGTVQSAAVLSIWKRVVHRRLAAAVFDPPIGDQPGGFAAAAGALLGVLSSWAVRVANCC